MTHTLRAKLPVLSERSSRRSASEERNEPDERRDEGGRIVQGSACQYQCAHAAQGLRTSLLKSDSLAVSDESPSRTSTGSKPSAADASFDARG